MKVSFVLTFAVAGLALVTGGWRTLTAEDTLKRAKADLTKHTAKGGYPEYSALERMAKDSMEELKLPPEFKILFASYKTGFAKHEYTKCADIANRMEGMLPRKHPIEYPFDQDFLIQWRAEIGELRMKANDYRGALREFDRARTMKAIPRSDGRTYWPPKDAGYSQAAWGQARVHAVLGNSAKAMAYLKEAPGLYWSGCGNCEESSEINTHRLQTVWKAALQPPQTAEEKLLKIIDGQFQPCKVQLNPSPTEGDDQRRWAKAEAAFMLGEIYMAQNRKGLAKMAFQVTALGDAPDIRVMAQSRLRSLGSSAN